MHDHEHFASNQNNFLWCLNDVITLLDAAAWLCHFVEFLGYRCRLVQKVVSPEWHQFSEEKHEFCIWNFCIFHLPNEKAFFFSSRSFSLFCWREMSFKYNKIRLSFKAFAYAKLESSFCWNLKSRLKFKEKNFLSRWIGM